jgi:hypothetical protein
LPANELGAESKAALWTAAVDYIFGLMRRAMWGVLPANAADVEVPELAAAFAEGIRRFVGFAAEHPELNQIIVVEGTTATDRSAWMTQTYVKPFFDCIRPAWQVLRSAGIAAPIDHEVPLLRAHRGRVVALRQRTRGAPTHRPRPKRSSVD